jgi:hypothetical protein
MKEVGWDVPLAIGEYDYSGPEGGVEISGAVAQAESLAAFARCRDWPGATPARATKL